MSKVLVLDGKSIASVSIVRSLGKRGIAVTCGEEYRACPGFFSRYVRSRVVYPSAEKHPELFLERIRHILKNDKYDLVVPIRDETTMLLAEHRDELSQYTRVPTAPYETIMKARNKISTLNIAIDNDIPCPRTYFPDEKGCLAELSENVTYPALVRPCESSGGRGIVLVDSAERLETEYVRVKRGYGQAFVQEYVPSKEGRYLVHALFNERSEPVAACVIQTVRCYPINGGPTAVGETVINAEVLNYGLKMLKAMDWQGVAEVEFLMDERDSKPKLLEVNPRFGMPVGLAVSAGIDIPYLLYSMTSNRNSESTYEYGYKAGIRWRWLFPQDILWFLATRDKASAAREFFKFYGRDLHYAVLAISDPGPTLGVALQSIKFLLSREKRDFIFKRGW